MVLIVEVIRITYFYIGIPIVGVGIETVQINFKLIILEGSTLNGRYLVHEL